MPCSGDTPTPRSLAAASRMMDKVYLLGGNDLWGGRTVWKTPCLYELTMHSFTWTRIDITGLRPHDPGHTSLIPVAHDEMLVYGEGFTRIYHVQSHTWKELLWSLVLTRATQT